MKKVFSIFLPFIVFSLISCEHDKGKISIVPIKTFNYIDTLKSNDSIITEKVNYFLVRNFSGSKKNEEYLDSFVKARKEISIHKNSNYSIVLYKQSAVTNIANLKSQPKILDRYSQDNDLIYIYSRRSGDDFFSKFKFKDGEIINHKVKNLKIGDVLKNEYFLK